eukprot:CAMPEP_0196662794 /NCGR_PEP_ID=MMETSP1086-20130531/50338_1 /TAXON_ID=77921 /ORGANISM="Cyanoptyche  gloeocystis , Strain SAG4.97" /LENGTH=84 /DNA_ID=CAMNT_0041998363 /DNA_START=257 /DNA_END=508 /DNA_ORIENTATION=+
MPDVTRDTTDMSRAIRSLTPVRQLLGGMKSTDNMYKILVFGNMPTRVGRSALALAFPDYANTDLGTAQEVPRILGMRAHHWSWH